MVASNYVFTLLAMENDRSPVALVAGFTTEQEFTINNNLSYRVSLMISKTLNRFQNIGKAINLRILDQHFQNFELGKKDIQLSSIAVDHMSLLIADSSWIVRPRVTAAMHQSSFRYFSRYFTETAETCHCSDIKCAVLITIPSPSKVVGF